MKRIAASLLVALLGALPVMAQSDAPSDPEWLADAIAALPEGYVAGRLVETSADGLTASLAAYHGDANDPANPATTFEPGHVLVVKLRDTGLKLAVDSVEFREREPIVPVEDPTDRSERGYAYLHREIWRHGQERYPSGTEACDLYAWSVDTNPDGLKVYLKPSADSRLLGSLPPLYDFPNASEAAPEEGFVTEFHIIGYADGWFMIEHAEPPGREYVDPDEYPDDHPEPFAGRGWVPAPAVGANYANGDMPVRATDADGAPVEGLYQAPHIDANWTPIVGDPGGAGPKKILACSGLWALVESEDGVVGWWRRLCSSQVTVCS